MTKSSKKVELHQLGQIVSQSDPVSAFIEEEERESLNSNGIGTLQFCDHHWCPTKLIE